MHPWNTFFLGRFPQYIGSELGKCLCARPGWVSNTAQTLVSRFSILFRSTVEERLLWHPDTSWMSLSLSYCYKISCNLPRHLPTRSTEWSVIFAPNPLMASLQTRFKCSIWRSAEIFLPGHPCTLIVWDHWSCAILGLKKYLCWQGRRQPLLVGGASQTNLCTNVCF